MNVWKTIRWTLFCIGMLLGLVVLFSYTFGQWIPIEFVDWKVKEAYYDALTDVTPCAVLTILLVAVRKEQTTGVKIGVVTAIVASAGALMFIAGVMNFGHNFCGWMDSTLIESNTEFRIVEQTLDCGIGSGGMRTVRIEPWFGYWQIVTEVP
jgi:hypothetical protein